MADEVLTFDEILEDPEYKAEFDRRVTKALGTVQKKLDAEVKKNENLVRKFGTGEDGDDIGTVKQQLADLQKVISERDYADAVSRAIAGADGGKGLKFTSKSAKEAFEAAVAKKALKLKDGELEGFAEFLEERRKTDPDAFVRADEQPEKKAKFTSPTGKGGKSAEPMTREQIMAIPDRAARRRAIAENINLFNNKEDK